MMARWKPFAAAILAAVACLTSVRADTLKWDTSRDVVAAEVENWTVPEVLRRVASATGWQIFIDPEITNRVPTKFSEKQPGDALRSLLGKFNYALVPDVKGPSRLFVFRDSRDQATRALQPVEQAAKPKSGRIPNELVVTLKPGEKIEDLAKRLGAKIVGRSDAQNTYRLRFEDEAATDTARASLETDPAVEDVDSNYTVSRPDFAAQTLGPSSGPLNLNPKAAPDGKYIVIGLIDTAVQAKEGNFSQFLHSATDPSAIVSGGEPTHGTLMAEAMLRAIAANSSETTVRILPINVYPDGGEQTTTFEIAVGVKTAAEAGAHVINISSGGYEPSDFLRKPIKSVVDQGIPVNAAAGNDGSTMPIFPAAWPEANSVGALDPRTGKPFSWSNRYGPETWGPGSVPVNHNGQQILVQGTSPAAAVVSAVMASRKAGAVGTSAPGSSAPKP